MRDCKVPECGGRMKFSRVVDCGSFIDKRRDCACGYADRVPAARDCEEIAVQKKAKPSAGVRHVPHNQKILVRMKAEETHVDR